MHIIENTALVFLGQGKTISTRPGITLLIQGIESALSKHGGRLLIAEVNSAEALAARVENGGYTSLILSGDSPDKEVIKILDRFPSVWLLSRLPDLDIKICDSIVVYFKFTFAAVATCHFAPFQSWWPSSQNKRSIGC